MASGGREECRLVSGASAVLVALAALVSVSLHGCQLARVHNCSQTHMNCMKTGCCIDPAFECWARDEEWASCQESCTPSFTTACNKVLPGGKVLTTTTTPPPASATEKATTTGKEKVDWVEGTWTTGYWDCCKPSCSWKGKGKVNYPVQSCDAKGNVLADTEVESVCQGGTATTCFSNQPFIVSKNLSMGFAAAAVSGSNGLTGDHNCGMCYELVFVGTKHSDSWGGAHPDLVGKRMILQVSNIGKDVKGDHSFDILIPGAGQGIFTDGCHTQFPDFEMGDFDCDKRYGGCDKKKGCARLPESLRDGCEWRFEWYKWLVGSGKTNNPFVKFRRVKCPKELTDISGATPEDDFMMPVMM